MNNEEILQSAIQILRTIISSTVNADTKTPAARYAAATAPAILSILRVALKMMQIDRHSADSVTGFAYELNLAKAIVKSCAPDKVSYDTNYLDGPEEED